MIRRDKYISILSGLVCGPSIEFGILPRSYHEACLRKIGMSVSFVMCSHVYKQSRSIVSWFFSHLFEEKPLNKPYEGRGEVC